jgi:hypothetical protein
MVEEKRKHNPNCKSDSFTDHLCYIVSQGIHVSEPEKFEALIANPEFKCQHCGRVAKSERNLCEPVKM